MRVLLDTNVLLWAVGFSPRLDQATRRVLEDEDNEILFSAASIWEIAIKAGLRRADFNVSPQIIAASASQIGFIERPIRANVAALVEDLPAHHRDPFDRLLIAQAMAEPARLLTADATLRRYSELVTIIDAQQA